MLLKKSYFLLICFILGLYHSCLGIAFRILFVLAIMVTIRCFWNFFSFIRIYFSLDDMFDLFLFVLLNCYPIKNLWFMRRLENLRNLHLCYLILVIVRWGNLSYLGPHLLQRYFVIWIEILYLHLELIFSYLVYEGKSNQNLGIKILSKNMCNILLSHMKLLVAFRKL